MSSTEQQDSVTLDHMILPVNALAPSLKFYCGVLGFAQGDEQGPFQEVRASDTFVMLLSPYGTKGGLHLAFSFPPAQFSSIFAAIRQQGLDYGDNFDATSNGRGPTPQAGATGEVEAIYMLDPDKHLIELRCGR